jgi:5-formyltetrahydrofolate cyclo-ligase
MNSKQTLREKILSERRMFNEYKFHVENELIIENINIIINALYKDLIAEEKRTVKFKTHDLEIFNTRQAVGLYLPIKGEPDLTKIMLYNDLIFALPKIEGNKVNLHGFTPVVSSRLNSRVQAALAPNLLSPAAQCIF